MATPVLPNSDRLDDLSPAAGTTELGYSFELKSEAGLSVIRFRAGVRAGLVNGADYDFPAGLGDASGGTVTLLSASLAGDRYLLVGLETIQRVSDLEDAKAFAAARYNEDQDLLTIFSEEARRDIDRALKADFGGAGGLVTPGAAGEAPLWGADGGLTGGGPSADQIASAQAYAEAAQASAASISGYGPNFETVALLKASPALGVPIGTIVEAEGFRFKTVISGESWVTDGGDRLKVLPPYNIRAYAAILNMGYDNTAEWQAAFDDRVDYIVVDGETIINGAVIHADVEFYCTFGSAFKAKDDSVVSENYWNPGTSLFEPDYDGYNIIFSGAPKFDGNKTGQSNLARVYPGVGTITEPAGWIFKANVQSMLNTKPNRLTVKNGWFMEGTTGYLLVRGADNTRRFRTEVILDDCLMTDTITGYGKTDPATPNPLGWNSDYIQLHDYVTLKTNNLTQLWSAATVTGEYAPVGIRATFYGSSATSGGVQLFLGGKTRIERLGRKPHKYNDDLDFVTNNGIGAIDCYGNAEWLHVEHISAYSCENVPVRAKADINQFTVNYAYFFNCTRGLQVANSSAGTAVATIKVGHVDAFGGTNPQIEFVGNDGTTDSLKSVTIDSADISGGRNNQNWETNVTAAIYCRYCDDVNMGMMEVKDQDVHGILTNQNKRVQINRAVIDGCTLSGVLGLAGYESFSLLGGSIKNTGAAAVSINGTTPHRYVGNVHVDGAVDYGILDASTAGWGVMTGNTALNITGNSRAFYLNGVGALLGNFAGAGVTVPVFPTTVTGRKESANSWNP